MIGILIGLAIMTLLFGIAFRITGALLAAAIWLFIKLPIALVLWLLGLAFCCTIILIPLGISCFRAGLKMLLVLSII